MKLTLLKILLLFAILDSTLIAKPIRPEKIIIVEITPKDVGIYPKSIEEYHSNQAYRDSFRRASADFLMLAQKNAKFILVDMWYPDVLDMPSDESLLTALRLSSNITFAAGGPHKQKYEKSHPKFVEAVPEIGHILFNDDNPLTFAFWPTLCAEGADWPTTKHPCPKQFLQKHIALLAAEKFLGVELFFEPGGFFEIPRNYSKRFRRITYSDFKKSPKVTEGKLVILINKPLPNVDMFDIPGQKRISGSELLAMMVVLYSEYFTEK